MQMVTCTKANGKTIKTKEWVYTSMPAYLNMRGNGLMINNKEKELKLGKTDLNMMDIFIVEKNKVRVYLFFMTETNMKESFLIIILKEPALFHGRMEDDTKDSGRTIKCMVKDCLHGQTGNNIMVSILKTRKMDTENLNGLME